MDNERKDKIDTNEVPDLDMDKIFDEEDKIILFDESDDEEDMVLLFDDIADENLSELEEENDDDDLVFIDAVSVRDRRKINKVQMVEIPEEMDVEQKKTKRRTHDVNEIKKERSIAFAKKNIVLIGIGVLVLIVIIGAIIVGVKTFKKNHSNIPQVSSSEESYQVKAHAQIEELMNEYFVARADNDTYVLNEVLNPVYANEMEYIRIMSGYVDSYDNVVCYSTDGLEEGEYIVAAYYEVKFAKVREGVPGMQFFYVETNQDDELYINNIYSEYNTTYLESATDPVIMSLIYSWQADAGVASMIDQAYENYDNVITSSTSAKEMVEVTLPAALTDWTATMEAYLNVQTQDPVVPPEGTGEEGTGEETPDEPDTEEPQTGETAADGIVYATAGVNIRQTPSTDAAVVASAYAGSEMYRLAVTDNGWTKIKTGDVVGYIKSDYVSEEKPAGGSASAGSTITLSATTNVRAEKNTNSTVVETVPAGGTVTILEGDSEGWTKVQYNGTTGYIRSDLLTGN